MKEESSHLQTPGKRILGRGNSGHTAPLSIFSQITEVMRVRARVNRVCWSPQALSPPVNSAQSFFPGPSRGWCTNRLQGSVLESRRLDPSGVGGSTGPQNGSALLSTHASGTAVRLSASPHVPHTGGVTSTSVPGTSDSSSIKRVEYQYLPHSFTAMKRADSRKALKVAPSTCSVRGEGWLG